MKRKEREVVRAILIRISAQTPLPPIQSLLVYSVSLISWPQTTTQIRELFVYVLNNQNIKDEPVFNYVI